MTHRFLFIGLTLLLFGCTDRPDTPDARQLVGRLMDIWESGEQSELDAFVRADATYDDMPNSQTHEGLEGFKEYVRHVHDWAAEIEITVHRVGGSPEEAYAEWTMRGIQNRPIAGRIPVATGRSFTLNGLTVVEARDGKISRAADYIDVLGLVVQLGSRIELPGGTVIQQE